MRHGTRLPFTFLLLTIVGALSGALAQPGPGGAQGMRERVWPMLVRARGTTDQDWPQVRTQMLALVQQRFQATGVTDQAAMTTALTQIGKTLDEARGLTNDQFNAQAGPLLDRMVKALMDARNAPANATDLAQSSTRGLIDVHTHFMAITPEQRLAAAQMAVQLMDKAGTRMMLVMPPPSNGEGGVGADHEVLLPALQAYPERFAFLGGGCRLNSMIHQSAQQTSIGEDLHRRFEAEAEDVLRHGARGFGEMSILHLSWGSHHPYECAPGDRPLFLLLADIAARHNVPIDIHMDLVTRDMATPESWLGQTFNPPTLQENLSAFERLLDHNPQAKIIWEHMGTDTLGFWTPELTRTLLEKHPNLYIALRLALGPANFPDTTPFLNGRLKPEWLRLFQDYPTRFMVGSDTFVCPPGFSGNPDVVKMAEIPAAPYQSARVLLNQLPADVADKICHGNAEAVFGLAR